MKQGDFSELAATYHARTGYADHLLDALIKYTACDAEGSKVADVGAGTGKLTEQLLQRGLNCVAVEPNDAMREVGIEATKEFDIDWLKGSGEETGLETDSCQLLTMASSFHWVDKDKALPEFARVLKKGGYFTALWNPRDIEKNTLQREVNDLISAECPEIKRVSSGSSKYTQTIASDLVSTGHFEEVLFMEADHQVIMTPERYMTAWRSVNDIQAQAGQERWAKILTLIEEKIANLDAIEMNYKTRAWTARRI